MLKTLTAVGLSLALCGTALAKEKIDFMFPAPVDGKLTMEMTRVIKAFNDSQQDVEVRGIFTGNYDTTKIKAESAQKAGQPPALVIMSANFTTDLALKDEILPMDELFQYGDQKAGDFLVKEFWPAMHKNAQVMGTTYAIPFHNSTPILYYNKTMFDRAGIKQPPQTWAELLADARKLTDESKGQWGIMLPSTNDDYGGWIFSALVRANGGKYFNEDYPGEVYYNSPTTIGALRFWQDLIYKDKVMPSGVLNSNRLRSSNKPSWSCPCSTSARIETLLSAVIHSTPSSLRIVSMAFCEIIPRSPTITMCSMPNAVRRRCTSGKKVVLSEVFPSWIDTATGQPRPSVSKP